MSSPQERVLAEGLKDRLIGIQKAEQIYEELSRWKKKVLSMSNKEVDKASKKVASAVTKFVDSVERKTGNTPELRKIHDKIQEELEKV